MNIIVKDIVKECCSRNCTPQRAEILSMVTKHHFYHDGLSSEGILIRIFERLAALPKEVSTKQSQRKILIEQLSLYLIQENNKQIFLLYEQVLRHRDGISYEELAKMLHTNIINISHYCCKLKKLRLVDWRHLKDGIQVYPRCAKGREAGLTFENHPEESRDRYGYQQSFLFRELSMTENIWVNVSSEESISKGGLTNEQIKAKIMKYSENKMMRRVVDTMNNKYFDKCAERQGKVFEFRFKNNTQRLKEEIIEVSRVGQDLEPLDPEIQAWLSDQFQEIKGSSFLLKLINTKFKDYHSSIGVKQIQRQCTPLKLNRCAKVLNKIHHNGPLKEAELRSLIVEDERHLQVGTMHKRSLIAILEGLTNIGILHFNQRTGEYIPAWQQRNYLDQERGKEVIDNEQESPRKKKRIINVGNSSGFAFQQITKSQYATEIIAQLIFTTLQEALKRQQRKATRSIIHALRKKMTGLVYAPEKTVLHLLTEPRDSLPELCGDSLEEFYNQIDTEIDTLGRREVLNSDLQYELVKYMRQYMRRTESQLRMKYGKNWYDKLEPLKSAGLIDLDSDGAALAKGYSGFLV